MMIETIAAIATPPGEGGIAVIRVSGPDALEAVRKVFRARGKNGLKPRYFSYGHVCASSGDVIDEAMAVYMPAPHTYTCEDVCEVQCHGGSAVPARVLARLLETGLVRMAEPGEFTKRAFLNGRIDMAQAEAVMQLLRARSDQAVRSAERQLEGGVSVWVHGMRKKLEELLALVCAEMDFPEELDEDVTRERLLHDAEGLCAQLRAASDPRAARCVREGVSLALVGRPNVGKSSLLNAMLGYERAIVSEIPGTTRDVLTERIQMQGMIAELSDTAGQREDAERLEAIGVDRARQTAQQADVVLLVLDAGEELSAEDRALLGEADGRYLCLLNKTDDAQVLHCADIEKEYGVECREVSARTGAGVADALAHALELGGTAGEAGMTTQRHIACAARACEALDRMCAGLRGGASIELASDDLWQAMNALSEITGENATEDVIDAVFANFCVGK